MRSHPTPGPSSASTAGHMVSTDIAGAAPETVAKLQQSVAYRATMGENAWLCEWRLPFAACGFSPETSPLLLLNLGVLKTGQENSWVVWRGTGSATYVVKKAGTLVFSREFDATEAMPTQGLEVWLDAADPTTIDTDASGRVSTWRDKSGRERNGHQETDALRPWYDPEGLGGKPALRFVEEAETRLELPDLSDSKVSATIFAVFSNPSPSAPANHDPRIFTASDGQGYDYVVGLAASVPGTTTGGPRVAVSEHVDRWAKSVRVGCFSPRYQTYFKGHIAEIIVYSRLLSAAEKTRVQTHLALKWNLKP